MKKFFKFNTKQNLLLAIYLVVLILPIFVFTYKSNLENNPRFKQNNSSKYLYSASNSIYEISIAEKKNQKPTINFAIRDSESNIGLVLETNEKYFSEQSKNGSSVTFKPIEDNTKEFRYSTLPNGLKEDIILYEPPKENVFVFSLNLKNAQAKSIFSDIYDGVFYDDNGDYLFHFEDLYAVDSNGERKDDLSGKIYKKDNKYLVSIDVPQEWLREKGRKYPVIIDPTIVHDTSVEFSTGQYNRVKDTGSGSSPVLETYYQESSTDVNTVALWHFNEASGNALDSSGNSNTGTPTGTTIANGKLNNAREFNGSSDYITVLDSNSLDTGGNQITIEAWINPQVCTGTGDGRQNILRKGTAYVFNLEGGTCKPSFYWFNLSSPGYHTTNAALPINQWSHVAVKYDGSSIILYINGSVDKVISGVTGVGATNADDILIGAESPTTRNFDGLIDEIRISNRARSTEEIKMSASKRPYSVYTSEVIDLTNVTSWNDFSWTETGVLTGDGETAFDSTGLVAQWDFNEISGTTANNDAEGSSCGGTPANCDGTLTGFDSTASQDADPDSSWTANNRKWGNGALQFDGINSYVGISSAPITGTTYTVGTWIYLRSITNGETYFSQRNTANDLSIMAQLYNNSGKIAFIVRDDSNTAVAAATNPTSLETGQWYYVVGVRNGSNVYLYVNGKLVATDNGAGGTITTNNVAIGAYNISSGPGGYINGTVDTTHIYSRVLSESEIISNYNSSDIEFQTRVGADTTPNDGSWEEWKPSDTETQIENFDSEIAPSDIPNLRLWLDANDVSTITKDGSDKVSQWNDKSGNGYHFTQGTYSQQPVYTTSIVDGKPVIRFTAAASNTMTNSSNFGDACTVIYVSQQTGGSNGRVLSGLSNNWLLGYHSTLRRQAYFEGWISPTTYPLSDTKWHIYSTVIGGAGYTSKAYENGALYASATTGVDCPNGISLNGHLGTSQFSDADIAEVIAYNSMLTEDQLTLVENYLANKYDLKLNSSLRTTYDSIIKKEGSYSEKFSIGRLEEEPNTIGLWHLDETGGTGAYLKDSSGSGNHGTPTGTSVTQGISNKARMLNGTSDEITLGDKSIVDGADYLTVEAWLYTTTSDVAHHRIFSEQVVLYVGQYNNQVSMYMGNGSSWVNSSVSMGTLSTNTWHHVAWVKNGTTGYVYIDGKYSASITAPTTLGTSSYTNIVGGNGGTQQWGGKLDEVRVRNIASSPEEIMESYNTGKNRYYNKEISTTDLSGSTLLPIDIAADRTGSYLNTTIGETAYANYQPDANTIGLWHLDDEMYSIASGGTVTTSSGDYIHTFTSTGTFQTLGNMNVETLLIGGGGGGANTGSGGGGGGYLYDTAHPISAKGYTATIGGGGTGGQTTAASGAQGGSTVFDTLTAIGGGGGVSHGNSAGGGSGGSGGGGAIRTATPLSPGGIGSQGYNGGAGYINASWVGNSGGGGGAGQVGTAGGNTSGTGKGGNGLSNSISGTATYYGGGGGGGEVNGSYVGAGGLGGGGNANMSAAGSNGTANTGGGGGGGSYTGTYYNGGNGGSGIVIIRYASKMVGDNSSYGNFGSAKNTSLTTGVIGNAHYFNGSAYINLGNSSALQVTGSQTIEMWLYPTDYSIRRNPYAKAYGGEGTITHELNGTLNYYYGTGGGNTTPYSAFNSNYALQLNKWSHIALVRNLTDMTIKWYINGILTSSETAPYATATASSLDAYIGNGYTNPYAGSIDEVRISNVARTADQIRQAYEIGTRTHQITIDFAATLDSGDLITGSGDTSFIIDATTSGLNSKGSNLYLGDKIIVRENYNGTEYITQGTVSSVNISTGAVSVVSWDSGGTFPASGYTVNADVFKWQREYIPLNNLTLDSHINSVANITLKVTDGNESRTIWFDDLRTNSGYLTNFSGSTIASSSGNQYIQYRSILSSSNYDVSASLSSVTTDYLSNYRPNVPSLDSPSDTATSQTLTLQLKTTATDTESDYLRYKIELCENSEMTLNCQTFDQTVTQTGWSGQNTEANTAYTSGTQATYTVQSPLSEGTTYYWRSYANDQGGSNLWSYTQNDPYSFTTNTKPTAPTLWSPADTQVNVNLLALLQLYSTDADSDNLQYKITICDDASLTVNCQIVDQTNSQTGWINQNQDGGTTYSSGFIGSHRLVSLLNPNSTYYWKGIAIDPSGSNIWSDDSSIYNFVTTNPPTEPTGLKVEGLTNPTSVTSLLPEFKATHHDPDTDSANYYQLEVNTQSDFGGTTLWDSGKTSITSITDNSESTAITYAGTSLGYNGAIYYWRVKFWDTNNAQGAWSDFAQFTMLTLHQPSGCYLTKANDNSSLTLHWNDTNASEDGYVIEKNTNGVGFVSLITKAADSTSHQDSSISNGNTYQYRVSATKDSYSSSWCTTTVANLQLNHFLIY